MTQAIPTWWFVLVPLCILALGILMSLLHSQVECKACGWFMQYSFRKPKKCKRCQEKI